MNPETIVAAERIIEKFGFPIFVACVALLFFWAMFSYMKATVTKKDGDFLAYIESSNKRLADYVARRDEQINAIVNAHNRAFQENSHALARLSDSIELRMLREIRGGANDGRTDRRDANAA